MGSTAGARRRPRAVHRRRRRPDQPGHACARSSSARSRRSPPPSTTSDHGGASEPGHPAGSTSSASTPTTPAASCCRSRCNGGRPSSGGRPPIASDSGRIAAPTWSTSCCRSTSRPMSSRSGGDSSPRPPRRSTADRGIDGTVTSDLTIGGGLSSSSSLTVAAALALGATSRRSSWRWPAGAPSQRATGVPCGIMDQLVIATGGRGPRPADRLLHQRVTPVAIPDDVAIVVVDSGQHRSVATSEYADARRAVRGRRAR